MEPLVPRQVPGLVELLNETVGVLLTVMLIVLLGLLTPQELTEVADNTPEVAVEEKLTETLRVFPPVIVAPVPEYDQV